MTTDSSDVSTLSLYIEEISNEDDDDDTELCGLQEIDNATAKNSRSKNEMISAAEISRFPKLVGGGTTLTHVSGKLYSFGGCDRMQNPSKELRCYDLESNSWIENLNVSGPTPTARFGHTAVAYSNAIYIYGGQGLSDDDKTDIISFGDLHRLDTKSLTWSKIEVVVDGGSSSSNDDIISPPPRNSHTAEIVDGKMIVFGGANRDHGPMNDLWVFDFCTFTWEEIRCDDDTIPEKREMHSSCSYQQMSGIVAAETTTTTLTKRSSMVFMMGGRKTNGDVLNDLWKLDTDIWEWEKLDHCPFPCCSHSIGILHVPQAPRQRQQQHDPKIVNFGGWNGKEIAKSNIVTIFDITSWKWSSSTPLLWQSNSNNNNNCHNSHHNCHGEERFAHASCTINEMKMMIFGGVNVKEDLSDLSVISFD